MCRTQGLWTCGVWAVYLQSCSLDHHFSQALMRSVLTPFYLNQTKPHIENPQSTRSGSPLFPGADDSSVMRSADKFPPGKKNSKQTFKIPDQRTKIPNQRTNVPNYKTNHPLFPGAAEVTFPRSLPASPLANLLKMALESY